MNIVLTTLNAKYIHTSLALRYLKAYAEKDFPSIELIEYTIHDLPSQIVAELYRRQPDVIGFSVYIWNVEQTITVLQMLRKVLPSALIVLGGPEVSYDIHHWMKRIPEVDVIVAGEGEATFHELLRTVANQGDLSDVLGIAYRAEGRTMVNMPRPKLDASDIPNPYQDEEDIASLQNRIVYFESSRGCPFSCQFCLSSIESGVRYFEMDRVKAELLRLIDAGVKTIKFVDRTFNLNRSFALELFQFLIDHQKETVFQFEITGDILSPEIVDFLALNAPPGLFRFEIGVQSTNDATNTIVQRRQNFDRLSQTIRRIRASGKIVQHLDLIAGLPEEDYNSFRKTFNDVFQFEAEELQLGFLKMLRGTGLRQRAAQHDYVYVDQAPYEILSNNMLSYDDVLRIKQVEDVLEKYWNDGVLRNTVRFLVQKGFGSPFDFFQQLGSYWDESGYRRIGHQLVDLFTRLQGFLHRTCGPDIVAPAETIMMYEFLMHHRVRPHKQWWPRMTSAEERRILERRLAARTTVVAGGTYRESMNHEPALKDLERHGVIERISFDINALLERQEVVPTDAYLIVYYPPKLSKGDRPTYRVVPVTEG